MSSSFLFLLFQFIFSLKCQNYFFSFMLSLLLTICLHFLSGMIVTSALIIWKGLMCVTGSESPVVVVLSGSMEPGFKRVSCQQLISLLPAQCDVNYFNESVNFQHLTPKGIHVHPSYIC